jgi:hypothetical protein
VGEWQDQQQTKAWASRSAIQQRIQQSLTARKGCKLDTDQKKTAERLKELVKAPKAGEFIQNKTLKRWLIKEQFDSIAERLESE